jgi:Ca-activated chloride channel family protein
VLVGTPNGVVTTPLVGGYKEQIRVPPSPGTLQEVARTTGGEFFRARTSAALSQVYAHLATRVGHKTINREVTDLFAGGAIVVLLLSGALSLLWFRRVMP